MALKKDAEGAGQLHRRVRVEGLMRSSAAEEPGLAWRTEAPMEVTVPLRDQKATTALAAVAEPWWDMVEEQRSETVLVMTASLVRMALEDLRRG